jgi:hypothetical protein
MEHKYLSDGRKVAVIGQLNNHETIVQEVFVTDAGDEIPSGERFTVKSLHDEPVLSWKAKRAMEDEAQHKKAKRALEDLNKQINQKRDVLKGYQQLAKDALKSIEGITPEDLERLSLFLSGSYRYVVQDSYRVEPPQKLEEAVFAWDSWRCERRYEGMKLLNVFGRSDGQLSYRINSYSDGSGSWTEIAFCQTEEEALARVAELAIARIESGRLSAKEWETCKKLGLSFTRAQERTFMRHRKKALKESIKDAKERATEYTDRVDQLCSELKALGVSDASQELAPLEGTDKA